MKCESCGVATYVVHITGEHKKVCPRCYDMKGIRQIRLDEGKRFKLYKCTADKWTIGIGRNLSDRGINQDEMELMFSNDIAECLDDLPKIFPKLDTFTEDRQGAFLNMRFQLGPGGIRKFKKMVAAANAENWKEVVIQAKDSKWYKQTPERAKRVVAKLAGKGKL